ncbi:MAG: YaeQ family protein [Proteobacteria bacterium]|nr:YaeQ family protein [Pseudomonadota bacterium]
MAIKSTVCKAKLNVADLDRAYYGEHSLIVARHPSETDERMMVRLLAFALFADERMEFGKGLSTTDEPALWLKEYSGEIRLWIEVGLPDERVLRRAAGRAAEVIVLVYGGRAAELWWGKEGPGLERLSNLRVWSISVEESAGLTALATRGMDLQCTIQEGRLWFSDGNETVQIEPRRLNSNTR